MGRVFSASEALSPTWHSAHLQVRQRQGQEYGYRHFYAADPVVVRSLHVEVDVLLGFLDFSEDLGAVMEGINLLEEDNGILLDLLRSFGSCHVLTNIDVIVSSKQF